MPTQSQQSQSSYEERIYPLDFTPGLLEGVTLVDVSFIYSGANDEDSQPNMDATIDGNIAYVAVSDLEIGSHRLSVIAQTTNADLSPEIMLLIETKY